MNSLIQGFLWLAVAINVPALAAMSYYFFKYRNINQNKQASQAQHNATELPKNL